METTENNKLIAEFENEHEFIRDGNYFYPYDRVNEDGHLQGNFSPDEMQYHTSWDWLMPVVDVIMKKAVIYI
jgi:hypothetical protein